MTTSETKHRSIWADLQGVPFEQGYLNAGGIKTRYLRAGTRGAPALTITVGETDGSIGLCFNCSATVTNLDELEELVASTPSFFTTGPPERHSELVLGGELARSDSAGIGNNCLGCPNAYYHVFTIHHGRPVVLAFDYWTVRFESMVVTPGNEVPFTQQMLDAILQSFRFTDG